MGGNRAVPGGWFRRLALSDTLVGRSVRWLYFAPERASIPIPGILVRPVLLAVRGGRTAWHAVARIFFAEPLFRAYCHRYGRGLRTGPFLHWIDGPGRIIVGDDVLVDGKSSFSFAARFTDHPTLVIGDRTGIGHACHFAIAKGLYIGNDCRIASNVRIFDSSGHPLDPERRRRGDPPDADSVKEVRIEDNVWIGAGAFVFPGVTIGAGSVVSAGAVVLSDVPPNSIVAGNPARRIGTLGGSQDAGVDSQQRK